ncbi:MAG TPA: nucleotidyltransferase domain-containing protein [Candidatus Bipolaricaulis sp.]|nr:nucleotidyltransferase domain-containing protein [Candidatus Bipolaricaulis sp.]HRS13981.1 nucleotidyltransferase domain-containing protein [Candidatus Bipolaricaulis sp.]HRU22229.1 nucleotidyltransferase domain-containing protein [Candidatus Bipolaricaulis sp.]
MKAVDDLLSLARDDPDVLAVLLYGSQARGDAGPRSDTDVCLVLRDGFPRDDLPGKALAYLGFNLDARLFQALPLPLRRRILREGKVLFVRDEDGLYNLAIRTAKAWEDFRHVYEDYLEAVGRGP